jgi:hypothetical protein
MLGVKLFLVKFLINPSNFNEKIVYLKKRLIGINVGLTLMFNHMFVCVLGWVLFGY